MSSNSFDVVITHVGSALAELASILSDDTSRGDLLSNLGYDVPGAGDLAPLFDDVADAAESVAITLPLLIEAYENESADSELAELLFNLTDEIINAMSAIDELTNIAPVILINQTSPERLGRRLLDFLLLRYLQEQFPVVVSVIEVVGLADVSFVQDTETQPAFFHYEIHWDRFKLIWSDPKSLFELAYGWGTDTFDSDTLLTRIQALFWHLGISSQLMTDDSKTQLETPVWSGIFEIADEGAVVIFEAGLLLEQFSDSIDITNTGLLLSPYVAGELGTELEVAPGWKIELTTTGELNGALGTLLQPQSGLRVVTHDSGAPIDAVVSVELTLARVPTSDDEKVILLGDSSSTRWEADKLYANFGFTSATSTEPELMMLVGLQNSALVIEAGDGDSFLSEILPPDGIKAVFEVAVGWSSIDGFYFQGSAGFEITIPIHLSVGPVELESIYIILNSSELGFDIALGVSINAELGPISASIQRIGLQGDIMSSKPGQGNFGPVDLSLGFLPPLGAGLSINSGIVGGGFLDFDNDNKRYAGILALQFGEIGLTAIGLITTKLPDGSKGFSLLVNIGVTFDPPIQLSFGFTLMGVGGLIGINRTMNIEALQHGIKTRTLDSILFPDPDTVIANASKIISDMRTVFPAAQDRFVIGPMVKIGWGSPAIITADLGIFLELPDPIRVVLMGQLEAILPDKKKKLVVIHLDVLGVLDLEKEELTFQASLYDSRILQYPIAGDSAFLLNWSNNPQFALSLGGFHPKFAPPSPPIIFADLKRLSISISKGKNFQLTCRAYMAVTPNSVQFGARVDLFAKALGATVTGYLGFDALFYLSPFSFEVHIFLGVRIKYKGVSLADVDLSFYLSGPTPWNARGKGKFKVLFFKIKFRFNITWGSEKKAILPAIDPWIELEEALLRFESWGTVLPVGRNIVESLRSTEDESVNNLVVHPAGRFEVRQNVVPLAINLSKVGNSPIKEYDRFDIPKLKVGDEFIETAPVEEFFSRGQFEKLSTAKKLSVPAFEKMKGGVTTAASQAVRVEGDIEQKELTYESILIQQDRTSMRPDNKDSDVDSQADSDWEEAQFMVAAKARRSAIQRAGSRNRFAAQVRKQKASIREERYAIVVAGDLKRADLDNTIVEEINGNANLSRMEADQALQRQLELDDVNLGSSKKVSLIIVPEYEVQREVA